MAISKLAGNSLYIQADLPLEQLQGSLTFDDNKTGSNGLQALTCCQIQYRW